MQLTVLTSVVIHTKTCTSSFRHITVPKYIITEALVGWLTLCWVQCPKTSARGRRQNVPKHPVAIGKLRCFQTRKFPYNLARISWIITVRDFRYFLLCHLHCLCVQSESERVFKVESKKRVAGFRDGSLQWYQTMTNDSMAFMLKISCFEKL